jgi:uncharacterized caspase-like protein
MAKGGFHIFLRLLLAWLTLAATACLAAAEEQPPLKGLALVIGQSKYAHIAPLDNPTRDAEAMRGLLQQLGFEVTLVTDQSARKLKRDLDNFAADAADAQADVAVVFYSGHGIEAGGENYLAATDLDPAAAADGLVPVSDLLTSLKSTVPVSIVLLDACRSNPFPPGFALSRDGAAEPVTAQGLGVPRGMSEAGGATASGIGMVLGFAASPGTAALDGVAGGNSPYTAALLRHLSAMNGAEFGQVMRMVTEEVYLATQGRQRPWINETLTKFLYFGGTAESKDAVARRIDGERRPLLLMIADLPQAERDQVETLARRESVPLATLYGVLRALGETDMPKDEASLERLLAEQASQLRRFRDERAALDPADPDLKRLLVAADQAQADGALIAAREFLAEAKSKVAAGKDTIEATEAALRAKRLANGAIYARSGEAAALAFDYRGAAEDYAQAYDWVKDTGDHAAWDYLWNEAGWLSAHGQETGDAGALDQAAALYRQALVLAPRDSHAADWATTQSDLGSVLRLVGEAAGDAQALKDAIAAFRAALDVRTAEADADGFAATQMNLGNALNALGQITGQLDFYVEALAAYQAALPHISREVHPLDWAKLESNIGTALKLIGDNTPGTDLYQQAVAAFTDALSVYSRADTPIAWATAQSNLGSALSSLGERETGVENLQRAVAAFEQALLELTPDKLPARWGRVMNNLGNALRLIGLRETGTTTLARAAKVLEQARGVRSRDEVPMQWALTTANIGNVLGEMGVRTADAGLLAKAVTEYDAALEVFTPERAPPQWAMVAWDESRILLALGKQAQDRQVLQKGLALTEALATFDRARGRSDPAVADRIKAFKAALRKLT